MMGRGLSNALLVVLAAVVGLMATATRADNVVRITNFPMPEDIEILGSLNGTVYFATSNIGTSTTLYKIDKGALNAQSIGTFASEGLIQKTITHTVPMGDEIFFAVQDVADPGSNVINEIWKHSAGLATVQLVKSIPTTGTFVGDPRIWSLTDYQGQLVFTSFFVNGSGQSDYALFTSDGTGSGTLPFDPPSGTNIFGAGAAVVLGNVFYFNTAISNRAALCRFDGTDITPLYVFDINGQPIPMEVLILEATEDRLYVTARHDTNLTKQTIWTSDGLVGAEPLIADGFDPALPVATTKRTLFGSLGDFLYFSAHRADQSSLDSTMWRTNGSDSDPSTITEIVTNDFQGPVGSTFRSPTEINGALYFDGVIVGAPNVLGLFKIASNSGIHELVKYIEGGLMRDEAPPVPAVPGAPGLRFVPTLDGRFVFQADDRIHGFEMWISDGTESGTMLLDDTYPGSETSDPLWLTAAEDDIYFVADAGDGSGREVYRFETGCVGSVRNADGKLVACFNNNGVLWVAGTFEANVQGNLDATGALFVIFDDDDDPVITIDSDGNMRTKGALFENQSTLSQGGSDRFAASDPQGVLSYLMRANGDILLTGTVLAASGFL